MEILLNNKKCLSSTFTVQQNDNLTNKVEFVVPRNVGDIDLGEFVPKIVLDGINTLVAGITENVEYIVKDSFISIIWLIDGVYTYDIASVKGQVSFNANDGKVKYSSMFTMNVVKSLESEDWDAPDKKSVLDEYLSKFNQIKIDADEVKELEEKAREYAAEAELSANSSRMSERICVDAENNSSRYSSNASLSADSARSSERNALRYSDNAKDSETNAKTSEIKSKASESNARESELKAKQYAETVGRQYSIDADGNLVVTWEVK